MLVKITAVEQAENILRALEGQSVPLVFDIAKDLDAAAVPLVYRRCTRGCSDPKEYLGANVYGTNFWKPALYCGTCGFYMDTVAAAVIAIQGDRVLATEAREAEGWG